MLGLAVAALALSMSGWQGCSGPPRDPILLIGIDGADWRIMQPLLAQGRLPHLRRLIDEGVSAPLASIEPLISPVIWTTIGTGRGPDRHDVLDFTMPDPQTGRPIPVVSLQRKAKAFWNILSEEGLTVGVVGWWATWPAQEVRGCMVSDRLSSHAFIRSPETTENVTYPPEFMDEIAPLLKGWEDVSFETVSKFMNVSKREFDERRAFDFKDPITHFRHIHASMDNIKNTALRVLDRFRPEVLAVYFEGVDTASHLFMRYAPPPYPYASDDERRKFGATVDSVYAYQDHLLGELLDAAGPRARVMIVSDHGFLSGASRPLDASPTFDYATAAQWHHPNGVFILHGPGVRGAAQLNRASVFDITPTLLALAGVPVAEDMEGQVLREALGEAAPELQTVKTYEDPKWNAARARRLEELVMTQDTEVMERLRSLGYIGAGGSESMTSPKGKLALAEYFLWKGEARKAERELHDALRRAPDYADAFYHLGLLKMRQEDWPAADSLFRRAIEIEPKNLAARQNFAYVLKTRGDQEGAVRIMEETRQLYPLVPQVLTNLAMLYREAGEPAKALDAVEEAAEIDPRSHTVLVQRALSLESLDRWSDALTAWGEVTRLYPDDGTARQRLEAVRQRLGR